MAQNEDAAPSARAIHDMLRELPLNDRLCSLMCAVIDDEPSAVEGLSFLVACVGMMARMLPPSARLRVCWALLEEVERIGAKWN